MSRFETMDLEPAEIAEGIRALERLKKQKIPGHAIAVAQNLAALSKEHRAIMEARKEVEERYVRRDVDDKPIPACVDERGGAVSIDLTRYAGIWKEDRTYEAGDLVAIDSAFYKARVNVGEKSKPTADNEAWTKIGKIGGGIYLTDKDAFDDELQKIAEESVPVQIRPIPASVVENNEDVTAEMIWLPMLKLEGDAQPKKVGTLNGKKKKVKEES